MAAPIDVDKVLAALGNKDVKANTDSLMGLAVEANKILSEFEKTCKILENMHVLPAIVRAVGVKYDIDVDTPLAGGLKPASDYHKIVFDRLNAMGEEDIGAILTGGNNGKESSKPDDSKHQDK